MTEYLEGFGGWRDGGMVEWRNGGMEWWKAQMDIHPGWSILRGYSPSPELEARCLWSPSILLNVRLARMVTRTQARFTANLVFTNGTFLWSLEGGCKPCLQSVCHKPWKGWQHISYALDQVQVWQYKFCLNQTVGCSPANTPIILSLFTCMEGEEG